MKAYMNSLGFENSIKENRDSTNISYILEQEPLFFETGYKVLQNQGKNGFAKCVRVSHNGKIKLVYDISKYKSLQSLIRQLTPESFFSITSRLFDIISEVKHNGFMQCENIDVDLDKIFIDCNNLNVFLIYLPVNTHTSLSSIGVFERKLKINLTEAISKNSNLNSDMVCRLYNDLQNDNYLLDDIKENMKRNNITREPIINGFGGKSNGISSNYGQENLAKLSYTGTQSRIERPGETPSDSMGVEKPRAIATSASEQNVQPKSSSNKRRLMKSVIIFMIQAVTAGICACMILKLDIDSKISMIAIGVTAAMDITASILVSLLAFREKKSVNAQVQNDIDFKPIYEGGATEVLDNIFMPSIALSGIGTPTSIDVVINKPEFILGKNPEAVDGVIQFNKAISRVHCKISYVNNLYMVQDLGSANGTYVNSVKLQQGQQVQIRVGDKVTLANSEFMVKAAK
jgi:hypothetical protein